MRVESSRTLFKAICVEPYGNIQHEIRCAVCTGLAGRNLYQINDCGLSNIFFTNMSYVLRGNHQVIIHFAASLGFGGFDRVRASHYRTDPFDSLKTLFKTTRFILYDSVQFSILCNCLRGVVIFGCAGRLPRYVQGHLSSDGFNETPNRFRFATPDVACLGINYFFHVPRQLPLDKEALAVDFKTVHFIACASA